MEPQSLQDSLQTLYAEVHKKSLVLSAIHQNRLHCGKGCSACCIDNLTVFELEAENIRLHHADFLTNETPHSIGKCAFLDESGACRIYANRPYVCRTQGLPLRWFDEPEDDEIVEYRDICELNEEGTDLIDLPAEECWSIGTFEARLAMLQSLSDNGKMTRIALRDLFRH